MPYTVITRNSRHPFETYTLAAGVAAGVAALFGNLWPGAIESAYPVWAQVAWGFLLAGGAGMALIGIGSKNRSRGILFEQVGLISAGSACGVYALILLWSNPQEAFAAACFFGLICAASFKQWWSLEKFIRDAINRGEIIRRLERGR